MFTDDEACKLFNGVQGDEDGWRRIMGVLREVETVRRLDKRVPDDFLLKLGWVWNKSNNYAALKGAHIKVYMDALFHADNPFNIGAVELAAICRAYNSIGAALPFCELLTAIDVQRWRSAGFAEAVIAKDGVSILTHLLDFAAESGDGCFFDKLPDHIRQDVKLAEAAFGWIEKRLEAMLAAVDVDSAEKVLWHKAALAANVDAADLFIEARIQRFELFTKTGRNDKAQAELAALADICGEAFAEEVKAGVEEGAA